MRTIRILAVLIALSACKTVHPSSSVIKASVANVPSGFVDTPILGSFDSPTALATAGTDLVFVAQQNGTVRVIKNDKLQDAPFAQFEVENNEERGLLGIAVDPDFAKNHFIFMFYTMKTPTIHHVIVRVTEENLLMKAGSLKVIHAFPTVPANNHWHQGGALHFGPDGKLYVALGNHEDSPTTVATGNSQNLKVPFGKILRFNSDGTIPSDNPFVANKDAYPGIWVLGLRNPFSFGLSARSGKLLINDVGQEKIEEINEGKAGANYGWPAVEGPAKLEAYVNPVYSYGHDQGCSVMGGVFYEPEQMQFPAAFAGKYFFMDYCNGWIKALDPVSYKPEDFLAGLSFPVALAIAADGSLYHLDRNDQQKQSDGNGTIGKVTYTGSKAPRITLQPNSQKIYIGDAFELRVAATDSDAVQWQRDGKDIPGAASAIYRIAAVTDQDNGASFRARFRNEVGATTSVEAMLTVSHNRLPVPTLQTINKSYVYRGGETIELSGKATDSEDGAIPGASLSWKIDFQHNNHSHPVVADQKGESIRFAAMNDHGDIANVWYRVYLTAHDAAGDSATSFVDIYPGTMLSSLEPVSSFNQWGPYERDQSNGEKEQGDGHAISLSKLSYGKGLGFHAPAEIVYKLDAKCKGKFIADVAVDDESGKNGSIRFRVIGDDKELFDSGVKKGGDLYTGIAVSVAGVKELRLETEDGGDGSFWDHGSWGSARVTECDFTASNATKLR